MITTHLPRNLDALLLLAAIPACGESAPVPPPPPSERAPSAHPTAVRGPSTPGIPAGALAAEFVRLVDGDTIDIAGQRVRFHGIDAFEKDQVCVRVDGISLLCGAAARAPGRARRRRHGRLLAGWQLNA